MENWVRKNFFKYDVFQVGPENDSTMVSDYSFFWPALVPNALASQNPKKWPFEPSNGSWITKVRASSWHIWHNTKMSHHHRGDHDLLYFTMHTNYITRLFCFQLPFLGKKTPCLRAKNPPGTWEPSQWLSLHLMVADLNSYSWCGLLNLLQMHDSLFRSLRSTTNQPHFSIAHGTIEFFYSRLEMRIGGFLLSHFSVF